MIFIESNLNSYVTPITNECTCIHWFFIRVHDRNSITSTGSYKLTPIIILVLELNTTSMNHVPEGDATSSDDEHSCMSADVTQLQSAQVTHPRHPPQRSAPTPPL